MDRKLFFSYIQNMQTNNPDMTGFQNSIRKNSWQKPRSIVEMRGGGHVYQGEWDAEDRRRQSVEDAAEREIKGVDFADVAEKAYNDLLSGANDLTPVQGAFDGFAHDPDAFHRGEGKYTVKSKFTKTPRESVIVPIDAGVHLGEHLPRGISDMAKEMAHERFMDALNKHHDYVTAMEAEADARDWHADRQKTHGTNPNNPLKEATLRTHPAEAYRDIPTNLRQTSREWATGRVMDALMDPNHPINADPANQDERDSLIRVLTDMGHFKHKQYEGGFDNTDLRDMGSSIGKEFTAMSASDTTKTGPGTQSANVQDLRRFVKFKDKRVYQKPYFGQSPIGYIEPTDE